MNNTTIIKHETPWGEYRVELTFAKYANGQTAIRLIDIEDGNPFAVATVAVDHALLDGEVAIKNYSENEGILDTLINAGVVEKPHYYVQSGYVNIPVCKLTKEYINN